MARARDARVKATFSSLPSTEELNQIMRNAEYRAGVPGVPRRTATGRGDSYAMTMEEAAEAASLMDRSKIVSPLAGLPVSPSAGEFSFARDIFGTPGDTGEWDDYWEEEQTGYGYENYAEVAVTAGRGRQPADISLLPTSTINPERPRTVAAGYDGKRQVLTVVFRDGTFYNYYDVERPVWNRFKQTTSKGRFIAQVLDSYPRGTANMTRSTVLAREQVYRVARTGQLAYSPSTVRSVNPKTGRRERYSGVSPKMQTDRSAAPRVNPTVSSPPRRSAALPPRNGMRKTG